MVEGKILCKVKKQTKKKESVSLAVKKNKTLQLQFSSWNFPAGADIPVLWATFQ